MTGKKILYLALGILGLGLGALGVVLPLLPAFPFLMLAAFCFGRSSEKLDRWFKGTKLYQNNLETYVKGQGMTWKAKIRVMLTVTLLMLVGFLMMFQKSLYIPCAILGASAEGRMVHAGLPMVFGLLTAEFCAFLPQWGYQVSQSR